MTSPSQKTRSPESTAKPSVQEAAGVSRRAEGRSMVVLGMVFAALIVAMLNYLSFRHYAHWDWTRQSIFTLSDRSRAELAGLDRDVELWLLMSSGDPSYQDLRELLDRYAAESSHVTLEFVDPDRDPAEYRMVSQRFSLGDVRGTGEDVALVVSSGEHTWNVTHNDLRSVDFSSFDEDSGPTIDVQSEQAVTGGILEVVSERRTRVCLTSGHGEWSLGGGGRDLSTLQDEMRSDHLEVETLETRGLSAIPDNCDAVFVVGPRLAFAEEEVDLLRGYLRGGGNMLFALDAEIGRDDLAPTGLDAFMRELGVRVDRAIVLELDPNMIPPGTMSAAGPYAVADWGEHPITSPIMGLGPVGIIANMARPVRPLTEGDEDVVVLVRTSADSFAETDIAGLIEGREPTRDESDIEGPLPLAVATRVEVVRAEGADTEEDESQDEDPLGGRVVVVGDAEFFTGEFMRSPQVVNLDFASATVGWLTQRDALIELPARRVTLTPVRVSSADIVSVWMKVVVLLPLSVIFFGLAIWWNRRA